MRRASALASILLVASGCQPAASPAPSVDPSLEITLERRPCYGTCPFYRLLLTGDGSLVYEGTRFVAREGTVTERVPTERIAALVAAFAAAGFARFPERYLLGDRACGRYHTDAPVVITSIKRDGVTKRVEHDHGCAGAPAALTALEDRIDEVAESWRWTTGERP